MAKTRKYQRTLKFAEERQERERKTLTNKEAVRLNGLQKGRLRNLSNRVGELSKQVHSIIEKNHISNTKLSEHGKAELHTNAREMFRQLELFMHGEMVFHEGRKDQPEEFTSSDRMHEASNMYMGLSIDLARLEQLGLVEKGFKDSCIPKKVK